VNDTAIRLALYRDFVATGRAPSTTRLSQLTGESLLVTREALERLSSGRAIVLQPESREVLFAPPLSAIPTPFVTRVGARSYFAPCAWDALGAIAMLGGEGEIESSCACCGEAMTIPVAGEVAAGREVIHFSVPAARWWRDLVFT
jgi:hypothetical protein